MLWFTCVALTLVGGVAAYRLGKSTTTVGHRDSPGEPPHGGGTRTGRRLLHLVAVGCALIASWRLPGALFTVAPWLVLVAGYLLGLSAERRGPHTGPTGLVHGEHAPYRRLPDGEA